MPDQQPPPSHSDADAHHHEPILYSGDPIENGDGNDGRQKPQRGPMTPRLRGLPVLFLSHGAQVHVGGAPFTDRTTVDELVNRDEVRAAERRAVQGHQPLPDAFVFFNAPRTEVKVLLWSDRGFTILHQRLDEGTFAPFVRDLAPGDRISVAELAELFSRPARLGAMIPVTQAAAAPSIH